ncbi:Protein disulfide-isomerase MPD1 [Madurella mycetomatis]|uniref:protein disulfide-isomerase n=1 Tax=Madurella mycetomatis TaxID=100816 RepID=A0A175W890_9PEZI|nr:Protein disulfide-isomerase MPD1 [Madurella mycetomatis]
MHHPTLCAVAVALLSALPGAQAGLYTKKSPVLQVDAKDYDRLIAKSNYTSIVEFYAPWCGHCQNLKPAYEKAAKNLEGLAKVAAVNCDDDANKPFCGTMGVQGFPTLKIVRPKKGGGKPMVQDYQGQRTASAIVDAVVQQINNYVVKIEDKTLDKFLNDKNETAKAILFTEKGTTSTLLKSIAIDFSDVITIGQARNKETKTASTFGIDKFPTLLLLPGGDAPGIVYDGEMKKEGIVKFLSQAGEPNPESPKAGKKDKAKKSSSTKTESKTASSQTSATVESKTETPTQEAPVIVETALPIPAINTPEKLIKECLTEKSHTCVLAFVPSSEDEKAQKALGSLSQLAHKHAQSKRHLFPFYEVPKSNEGAASLLKALDLSGDVEIVAINARRGWWRHYSGADFERESVESWIDAIRMSEGVKKKLPEGIVAISVEEPSPEASSQPTPDATESGSSEEATPVTPEAESAEKGASDSTESTSTKGADPTGEPETAAAHDEL